MNSETSIIDSLELYSFIKELRGGAYELQPKIKIDQLKNSNNITVSEQLMSDTSPMVTTVTITQEPNNYNSTILTFIIYAILAYGIYYYFVILPKLNKRKRSIKTKSIKTRSSISKSIKKGY